MIGPVSETVTPRASLTRILGLTAVVDLVTGIVLSIIGVWQDSQPFELIGVLLLLSGGGMLTFVTWQRNKPTAL
jgi:hypothetical protein